MIRGNDIHYPDTGLICVENAHSSGGVVPLTEMQAIYELAQEQGVPVHLDGARIFNAALALGVSARELVKYCDSVNVCLSKGLCAPVGSLLLGPRDFINKARKNRKLMGGGLRQAGILAAAGILALTEMVPLLKNDHDNARYLAGRLEEIETCVVARERLDINMVFFTLPESTIREERLVNGLQSAGIKINGTEAGEYRFITNHDVSRDDLDTVVNTMKTLINSDF
jgi:threonine aldolase